MKVFQADSLEFFKRANPARRLYRFALQRLAPSHAFLWVRVN